MKRSFLALFLVYPLLLIAGDHDHKSVTKEVLAQTDSSWDGNRLPAYPEEPPFISVVKFTIPPESRLPWHEHPMINVGYLISGELTVVKEDGSEIELQAGDALVEVVDAWHFGRNDGNVPTEIVVVYAGVEGQPLAIVRPEPDEGEDSK